MFQHFEKVSPLRETIASIILYYELSASTSRTRVRVQIPSNFYNFSISILQFVCILQTLVRFPFLFYVTRACLSLPIMSPLKLCARERFVLRYKLQMLWRRKPEMPNYVIPHLKIRCFAILSKRTNWTIQLNTCTEKKSCTN